nr:AsmA-like C-terminal region-containing protein [uncultured Flavobacterium sp.]
MTKKWSSLVKKIGKFFLIIVLVLMSIYGILGWYVSTHHDKLLQEVREIANKNCKGEVTIGDLEVLFFRGFPNITIAVKEVSIKDSLWAQHKRTLLQAPSIYAEIQPWAIFLKKIKLDHLSINDAEVQLFLDAKGYSNTSVFSSSPKTDTTSSSSLSLDLNHLNFNNVSFVSDNQFKHKKFDFVIEKLRIEKHTTSEGWEADIALNTLVKSLTFNTQHGSFAKSKVIQGALQAKYSESKGSIAINTPALSIGEDVFQIQSHFGISKTNSSFSIAIINPEIRWQAAYKLLSDNISSKLKPFDFKDPFGVQCTIVGDLNKDGDPNIRVEATINNNELSYFDHQVTDCTFKGIFTNEYQKNKGVSDENSAILLDDFRGKVNTIPFTTTNMMILDLKKPIASGAFVSRFNLEQLNQTIVKQTVTFGSGQADFQLTFKADVVNLEMQKPLLIGSVVIQNASGTHVDSKKKFNKSSIDLSFTSKELKVNQIVLNTQNSSLKMKGESANFLNFYYDTPEKIVVNWDIQARTIDLRDFIFGSGKTASIKKSTTITPNFINILHQSNATVHLKAENIVYKKFKARSAVAQINVVPDRTILKEVSLQFGGGSLMVNGMVSHQKKNNHFNAKLNASKVNSAELLKAFDNFGSKALTPKSVSGLISVSGVLDGYFDNNITIVKRSLTGNLKLNLNNGALNQFEPLRRIGKYAFPFRNFDRVTIDPLAINIVFKNGFANLAPTPINTSVLNLDLAGSYGFYGNSNMQLDVHLRDPAKDKEITNKKVAQENRKKGITLHLQAIEEGNTPFKIKLRSKNEKLQ